jgi:hypothetical protein
MLKKFVDWLGSLFKDENGKTSSKRFIGIIAGLMLCITMYQNSFSESHIAPSESLVNAVAALAFGCLGLASVDKIWGKNGKKSEE